jgi:hypothetical protein
LESIEKTSGSFCFESGGPTFRDSLDSFSTG